MDYLKQFHLFQDVIYDGKRKTITHISLSVNNGKNLDGKFLITAVNLILGFNWSRPIFCDFNKLEIIKDENNATKTS